MNSNQFPERYRNRGPQPPTVRTAERSKWSTTAVVITMLVSFVALASPKARTTLLSRLGRPHEGINKSLPEIPEGHFEIYSFDDTTTLYTLANIELRTKDVSVRRFSSIEALFGDRIAISEMKAAGLLTANEAKPPFVKFNGAFLSHDQYEKLMERSRAKYFKRESPADLIEVYGTMSCSRTAALAEKLTSLKIPFAFRDLDSSPALGARANARLNASRDSFNAHMNIPIVEVNGVVMSNPDLETILDHVERHPASL